MWIDAVLRLPPPPPPYSSRVRGLVAWCFLWEFDICSEEQQRTGEATGCGPGLARAAAGGGSERGDNEREKGGGGRGGEGEESARIRKGRC